MLKLQLFTALCLLVFSQVAGAAPVDEPCRKCHAALSKGKSVHPALSLGCDSCHAALLATEVPHRTPKGVVKGLFATEPKLCYRCHAKAPFEKKVVHPALGMGCTVCHNPHASDTASLLTAPVGKLCVTCHEDQASGKHVLASISPGDDHPLRGKTNPLSPKQELSCISCHNPHASDQQRLFVKNAAGPANLCRLCHKKISANPDRI